MGIDCSGFVQMVFKLCGIKLNRDSKDQAEQGNLISKISEAKEGDLVFFGNESKINHVGMLLNTSTVIHASGKVKIEKIDEKGIFGEVEKDYTHFLKSIKRIAIAK
jgi:cell wall-associated NlpC family hydrolase